MGWFNNSQMQKCEKMWPWTICKGTQAQTHHQWIVLKLFGVENKTQLASTLSVTNG